MGKPKPYPPIAGGSHPWYHDPPFIEATYQDLGCGCQIVGNGTLKHPLTIKQCVLHGHARALLDAAKNVLKVLAEEGSSLYDGAEGTDARMDLEDLIGEAEKHNG